ncbi:MAG: LON peptidase substrate-binding domain-containing protein [Hyphomicrobiales bacterium]|nr:LON peptidase substrate-binding domain-containing protein [Hyphomicrobiales bacterium]
MTKEIIFEELPEIIPIFPLDKCVLLPKAILPLNIFEPKYLQMIEDAIKSGKYIGIIQPSISKEENNDTEKVGCLGKISTYVENDDGTLIVKLTGICRFNILEKLKSNKKYKQMKVSYQLFKGDLQMNDPIKSVDRDKLLNVISDYLNVNDLTTDWSIITDTDTEILINAFAMLSPFSSKEKQALLEATNIENRSEILIALSEISIASRNNKKNNFMQ